MSDVADFYHALMTVDAQETNLRLAKDILAETYPKLVALCPHSEALEYNFGIRGRGPVRVCKICGVEDHAVIGQTPGDEYDWGTAGSHDSKFWVNTDIEKTESLAEFSKYRKGHGYRVVNGVADES